MTDEERQRTMDFILEQQAQFTVNVELMRQRADTLTTNVEGLREAQARTDEIVSRLSTKVENLSIQVENLTAQVQNIARQQAHINEVVAVIADAQQHTDERLNVLIDVVQQGRNGKS